MERNYSKIRSELQKKKEYLLDSVKREKECTCVQGDEIDMANEIYKQEMDYIFRGRAIDGIKAINDALKRMDDGSYGICEECGDKINLERLKIIPFVKLCVSCQEEIDDIKNRKGGDW